MNAAFVTSVPQAIRIDVKIVSFVRAFRLVYDRGPSLREIMLEVNAGSKTTVSRAVARLVSAGRLVRCSDGPAVPDDVETAVALLRRSGWHVVAPHVISQSSI
ncbi:hypothetical protein ACQHGV_13495 [Sphingomonas pseudosanguinis]|uniref:hypothetical protein n=1 Tax=Sphingomonas pseudosanguinis TaxID=413712 RepID=UPI003F862CA5